MKSGILILCCFVQLFQINVCHCYDPYDNDYFESEESEHIIVKKSATICSSENQDYYGEPSRLSLPVAQRIETEAVESFEDTREAYVPVEKIPPAVPPLGWNSWSPYSMDDIQDLRNAYNGFPYLLVPLPPYSFVDPQLSVNSLPPVSSTQILETVPQEYYQTKGLEDEYFSPNVRAVRSKDEELLDQLKHDGIIPNIIPTMPVPFMRTADTSGYYSGQGYQAVYPGPAPECSLPLYISCSPRIVYGSLAPDSYGYGGQPIIAPPTYGNMVSKPYGYSGHTASEPAGSNYRGHDAVNHKAEQILAPVSKPVVQ